MHFRISSTLSFQRKTKRHVFLLLFVLTPVHLNWPSYATGKCYQSPRQLISTMKHWWLYITTNSLTIFKWKMRNLRLNLIYFSFFVQYKIHFGFKVTSTMSDQSRVQLSMVILHNSIEQSKMRGGDFILFDKIPVSMGSRICPCKNLSPGLLRSSLQGKEGIRRSESRLAGLINSYTINVYSITQWSSR